MVKVESYIDHIHFEKGNELAIDYSHWNQEANKGEGGYDFGKIVIFQDEKGIIIVSKKSKNSGADVKFKEINEIKVSEM